MSELARIGAIRSTAIAAANAVVSHLNLGLFISEFNKVSDYSLRACKLAGNAEVSIEGRTNSGLWVYPTCTVILKENRGADYPVDRVYVSLTHAGRDGKHSNRQHFVCTFQGNLEVSKLARSPHEESEVVVISNPNRGVYYFSNDHCQPHEPGFVATTLAIPQNVGGRPGLPEGRIWTREELAFVYYGDLREIPNPDPRYAH